MHPQAEQKHWFLDIPDILSLASDSLCGPERFSASCCVRHCPGTEIGRDAGKGSNAGLRGGAEYGGSKELGESESLGSEGTG